MSEIIMLPAIFGEAAREYKGKGDLLIKTVDKTMLARADLNHLIGRNHLLTVTGR